MKIKLNEISPILSLYSAKIKDLNGSKLPIKIAFQFAVIIKELQEFAQLGQDRREVIINNYAEKDENGDFIYVNDEHTIVKIKKEYLYQTQKEIDELNNMEKEITNETIKLDQLESLMDILTIEDLVILSPIVTE